MHNVRMYSIGHIMACVHVDTRFLDAKYTYHQNNGRGSVSRRLEASLGCAQLRELTLCSLYRV